MRKRNRQQTAWNLEYRHNKKPRINPEASVIPAKSEILTVVELDDLFLIDILGKLGTFWQTDIFTFERSFSIFQVSWKVVTVSKSFFDGSHALALLAKTDNVAQAYTVRSDVDFLPFTVTCPWDTN